MKPRVYVNIVTGALKQFEHEITLDELSYFKNDNVYRVETPPTIEELEQEVDQLKKQIKNAELQDASDVYQMASRYLENDKLIRQIGRTNLAIDICHRAPELTFVVKDARLKTHYKCQYPSLKILTYPSYQGYDNVIFDNSVIYALAKRVVDNRGASEEDNAAFKHAIKNNSCWML